MATATVRETRRQVPATKDVPTPVTVTLSVTNEEGLVLRALLTRIQGVSDPLISLWRTLAGCDYTGSTRAALPPTSEFRWSFDITAALRRYQADLFSNPNT